MFVAAQSDIGSEQCRMSAPVSEDVGFQRKVWVVERLSWVLLALVVVAALMGAFGDGWLSRVHAGPEDRSFDASYLRFARKQAPVILRMEVRAGARSDDPLTVWISSDYLERFTVNAISPEPERAIVDADGTQYRFAVSSKRDVAVIRFSLEAERAGSVSGAVGISRAAAVPIRQFIYP